MKKLFALWVLLASVSLFAQEDNKKEAKKWDVSNPGESFNLSRPKIGLQNNINLSN